MCIKKLYRWCGTTQWLNRISKQNLNEHEHNKDNLQSKNNEKCEHLRFCVETKCHGIESIGSTRLGEAVDIGSFLLASTNKMKYLSSNFLVYARITLSHSHSLWLWLYPFITVFVFLFIMYMCLFVRMRVVLYVLFFSLIPAHVRTHTHIAGCVFLCFLLKQTTGIS